MAWDLSLSTVTGVLAGTLIIAVGGFVLVARPHAFLHRLFFLLALVDGAGTVLFRLRNATDEPWLQVYFMGLFWYFHIAFIALLALFGLLFPRPPRSVALAWGGSLAVLAAALGALAAYVVDHAWFWSARETPEGVRFSNEPAGNLTYLAFITLAAALVVKLAWTRHHDASSSFRRQATFVFAGMMLAYAPYTLVVLAPGIASDPRSFFLEQPWDVVLGRVGYLVTAVVMSVAAFWAWRAGVDREERSMLAGSMVALLVVAAASVVFPSSEATTLLRMAGLLAYPAFLGYAIMRFEVFDIDRQLRRAATVSIATGTLAAVFFVGENLAQDVLQERLSGDLSSTLAAGLVAAVATTAVGVPIVRAARRIASRVVPELSRDEVDRRKLEVYRHALDGALADGMLREGESRTLAALRSALGISDAEHQRLVGETMARG